MIFSDIHVHTTYCDGKNSAEETVLAALEKNFVSIGFSGHSYTSFDSGWCMSEEGTEKYIGENGWKIKFFIPFNFIDKHFRTTERNFRGNFQFCCEDKDVYLTWNRIENPVPAFHKPEFFGNMSLGMSVLDKMTAECIEYGYNVFEMCEIKGDNVDDRTFLPSEPTHFSYSITKCVVSMVFGMLRDKGLIRETDKVADYLSEFFPDDVDPKWYDVTLENMLRHRNGGSGGGQWNKHIDLCEPGEKDFLCYIFEDKLPYEIGKEIVYCDSNYYVISRIIEKVVGMPVDEWALKNLFNPLHFEFASWSRCPQGHSFGGTALSMRTRDMAKLGMIYANNGVYEGKRYLSEEWIKLATNVLKVDNFGGYGYAVQKTAYMKDNEFYLAGAGDQNVVFKIGNPHLCHGRLHLPFLRNAGDGGARPGDLSRAEDPGDGAAGGGYAREYQANAGIHFRGFRRSSG